VFDYIEDDIASFRDDREWWKRMFACSSSNITGFSPWC